MKRKPLGCFSMLILAFLQLIAAFGLPAGAEAAAYAVRQITNETEALSNLGLNNLGQIIWHRDASGTSPEAIFLYADGASRWLSQTDTGARFPVLNNLGQAVYRRYTFSDDQVWLYNNNALSLAALDQDPTLLRLNNTGRLIWAGRPVVGTPTTYKCIVANEVGTVKLTFITDGNTYDSGYLALNDKGEIAWVREFSLGSPPGHLSL